MTILKYFILLLLQLSFVAVVQCVSETQNEASGNLNKGMPEGNPSHHGVSTEFTITDDTITTIANFGKRLPRSAIGNSPTLDLHSLQNMSNNDPCNTYGTCAFVNTSDFKYCKCDEQCHVYNDCCFDLLTDDNIENNVNTSHDTFACLDSDSVTDTIAGYFVIAKCLNESFKPELIAKCDNKDIVLNGPWVYGNDGHIYQNKFCAECNRVTLFQPFALRFYNVISSFVKDHINSTQEERFKTLLNLAKQEISKIYYRWESPIALDNRMQCLIVAPLTNISSRNCLMYAFNPVYDIYDNTVYRNIYCVPSQAAKSLCVNIFIKRITLGTFYDFFPLNIMFLFIKETPDHTCNNQMNGLCRIDELYTSTVVMKKYSLSSHTNMSDSLLKQIIFSLAWSLVVSPNVTKLSHLRAFKGVRENTTSIITTHIFVQYVIVKGFYSTEIMNRVHQIENADVQIRVQLNTTVLEMSVSENRYESIKERDSSDALIHYVYSKTSQKAVFMSEQLNKIQITDGHPFCDYVTVDTIYDDIDDLLLITKIKCWTNVTDTYLSIASDDVRIIITYTGSTLSIIFLIISMIVNKKVGLTRSVGGGNIQNLSVSLLIANVLFMTGTGANDYQMVCLVLGILLHYFWLLVFSFMSVTIVNIFRNIRGVVLRNTDTEKETFKTRIKLTTVGIVLPLVFMAPSCVFEYLGNTQFTPQYNGKICFPTGYPGNIIFFSGPITMAIAVNFYCLIKIIKVLYQHKEQTKHIRKSKSYQQVPIYLRMSVLTGSFWIIGIFGAVVKNDVIDYIFIVICSLQGVMIGVSNITTSTIRTSLLGKTKDVDT